MAKIDDLINAAIIDKIKLNISLNNILDYIVFHKFDSDIPSIKISENNEIVLYWNGYEISQDYILDCVKNRGYITADDFYI